MRCVLTDDRRLVRVELLGEVGIVEGTRRRLVIKIGCSGRQYRHSGCVAVDPWERHRPCHPCSS